MPRGRSCRPCPCCFYRANRYQSRYSSCLTPPEYLKDLLRSIDSQGRHFNDSIKSKGHRTGVTSVLYRALKRRERQGDAIVVAVDELRTSKIKHYSLNFDFPTKLPIDMQLL
ncbi:uncharacterized protein RHIMIDRAFT_41997 [Rhizopus microsporus ATCC 52813]|uniref:Uncharacterized protein n=1 Tax=Rhizopus microsporus ATCC 52813 TaxID=1340429 RepID=A0A2G4SMP9_RHIZD|nr:uncharacterized protein RHIMIDRAFT_41997 [Rhizopus microsporus ATCC 52813]PHZ10043.1 hypothetical protein RHIMIDRAFT_41997 [Rhizopus microsporus ATCC 52813]